MPISNSLQPRKQRRSFHQAALHLRHHGLSSHLAEALLVRYNRRNFPLAKGDTVKILRGAFTGHENKVSGVDLRLRKVTVEGVTITKADGKQKPRPVDPSNLLITRLNLTDPLRRDRLLSTARLDEATKAKLKVELEQESKAQKAEIEKFKKELADREAKEKEARREEGELQPKVDPVTQKPVLAPKEEAEAPHEHAGGKKLEGALEHAKEAAPAPDEKKGEAKKAEPKKEET